MKVIILAAGSGSRLGGEDPKPLTQLNNGKSILALQLETIAPYIDLAHVRIVVGYKKERIIESYSALNYVYNPHFAQENTAKSLLRALKDLTEDVIWMNGDVVFHPKVLELVLANKSSCMVVNVGSVGDEEVKYRTNSSGKILEVSKHVLNPQGEAVGINYFLKEDIPILVKNLVKCTDQDYFEKAIEFSLQEGLNVWATPIQSSHCTEIDFLEDLERANGLINQWKLI